MSYFLLLTLYDPHGSCCRLCSGSGKRRVNLPVSEIHLTLSRTSSQTPAAAKAINAVVCLEADEDVRSAAGRKRVNKREEGPACDPLGLKQTTLREDATN